MHRLKPQATPSRLWLGIRSSLFWRVLRNYGGAMWLDSFEKPHDVAARANRVEGTTLTCYGIVRILTLKFELYRCNLDA